ncbi:neuropilin-1a-like [Clytia hemisphaerica]|uniref:F5/8 type C domain-containing protein n=1 Tax=Clytia hemisphaerica TaxID=252671 RepID=A0A7M5XAB1_9CNID
MSVLFLESISVSILILFILSASGQNRGLFVRGRRPLPIDGHWNSWGPWSECYLNSKNVENFYPSLENFQIQNRNRSCDNPKPINGGEDCEPPTHRFKQCSCMNPLGMETKLIADSQISSTPHFNSYSASQGRIGDEYNGWCSNVKESHFNKIYLEIDFGKFANVGAIEMEGSNKNGRVTRYSLEYSLNGKDWENIIPKNGFKGKFKGNLVPGRSRANFSQHRVMKYLRVIPLKSYGDYPCLKIEPFGCTFTCGEVLTSDYGKISGNSRVDIDQNCLWRIEVLTQVHCLLISQYLIYFASMVI